MQSPVDLLRTLATFAEVGEHRNNYGDDEVVAEWIVMKGSSRVAAKLTLGDCRRAHEIVQRIDASTLAKPPALPVVYKAAYGSLSGWTCCCGAHNAGSMTHCGRCKAHA